MKCCRRLLLFTGLTAVIALAFLCGRLFSARDDEPERWDLREMSFFGNIGLRYWTSGPDQSRLRKIEIIKEEKVGITLEGSAINPSEGLEGIILISGGAGVPTCLQLITEVHGTGWRVLFSRTFITYWTENGWTWEFVEGPQPFYEIHTDLKGELVVDANLPLKYDDELNAIVVDENELNKVDHEWIRENKANLKVTE